MLLFAYRTADGNVIDSLRFENQYHGDLLDIPPPFIDLTADHTEQIVSVKIESLEQSVDSKHSTNSTHRGNETKSAAEEATMIGFCESNDEMVSGVQVAADEKRSHTGISEIDKYSRHKHLNRSNIVEADLDESNVETTAEWADVPLIVLDTYKGSSRMAGSRKCRRRTCPAGPSSNAKPKRKRQFKQVDGERFKCTHCDKGFPFKSKLERHAQIHAKGNLMGCKADSNGFYRCTLCVRRFVDVGHLSTHMQKSHKNGQHLHSCTRCLRQFARKTQRNRHERRCDGLLYECHLCKVYVTSRINNMQKHMRKHSGAKPFDCQVCGHSFTVLCNLRKHLNIVHSRKTV